MDGNWVDGNAVFIKSISLSDQHDTRINGMSTNLLKMDVLETWGNDDFWKPKTEYDFSCTSDHIDPIMFQYDIKRVEASIYFEADDPTTDNKIGNDIEGNILTIDITDTWFNARNEWKIKYDN